MKSYEFINENMDHDKDGRAVAELRAALVAHKSKLQSADDDQVYDIIDRIMTRIARSHSISGQKLHDMWVDKYKQIPDTWVMNEAFDQPYRMKWEKSEHDDSYDALVRLPDGSNLSIMFNQDYDDEGEGIYSIEFWRNNSQDVTGEGDAQRIFATVLNAIQQFIKKHHPHRFYFSASKELDMDADDVEHFNPESRAKLYNRLVQRYAGAWGYRVKIQDQSDIVRYELSRLKPAVAENNTAAGITKAFNNLGDPVFANLQRVALLAMQGRQSEAAGRLQTVIKDADPAVQKKITDAVNNIKPVTINGRVADSSTLDKSKQHNDWIINTFIPWVQSLLGQQGVTEGKQPGKPVVDAILKVMPVAQEIWLHGSRATGRHRRNSDTDILVVVPDDLVGDQYLAVVRILQKLASHFDNYDIQPTKSGTNIHRIAQEEGRLLWSSKQGVAEDVPQPGESSGAPKQFGPDAKIQTRQMTVRQIISSIPGVPYYNNVVDDWDAKDYSWGVTKKTIEYATYLKEHPESLAQLPPILVLNGKFEDGAHRVSAIWLLQQRMDPKNPLWANAKLNVKFVKQDVAENFHDGKNPGRKGLSKRMGVNTKASVSSLRNTAKHSTGEKARMAHWLANMKAGRAKAKK
jgi:predicted nucleotidyltransferase